MTKTKLLATAFAVAALSFTSAQANVVTDAAPTGMEKCVVVNAAGENAIMAEHADGVNDSVIAHQNKAKDAGAWIYVPTGECAKINAGDMSGISSEVKSKIDTSMITTTAE